jgi:hypothetical protein
VLFKSFNLKYGRSWYVYLLFKFEYLFSFFFQLDQLLADLQNVSQRARTAYENTESETRLEPMVLNRSLPKHRNQTLNLIRPDSIIDSVCSSKNKKKSKEILFFLFLGTNTKKC